MAFVLRGRRAKRYLGLAKAKLAALLRSDTHVAQRTLAIPAGTILLHKLGEQGRAIILVRDPYLAVFGRRRTEGVAHHVLYCGGLTGEVFAPELPTPTELAGARLAQSVLLAAGHGSVLTTWAAGGIVGVDDIVGTEPFTTPRALTTGLSFGVANYSRGLHQQLTAPVAAHCNMQGEPLVQLEPFGAPSATEVCTVALFHSEVEPGVNYSVLVKFTNPEQHTTPDQFWPPDTLNGGRPDLVAISSPVTCIGRGELIFLHALLEDWRTVLSEGTSAFEIVHLTEFGASFTTLDLTTIDATLEDYWTAHGGVRFVGGATSFAYSGSHHITLLLGLDDEDRLYRSADGGATWSSQAWPAGADETALALGFANQSIVSLYPGHVEFYTTDDDDTPRRYTSEDHGATWSVTTPAAGDLWTRPRSNIVVLQLDDDDKPVRYATGTVDDGVPKVIVFRGTSTHEREYQLPIAADADYTETGGEIAYLPNLCYAGAGAFVPPLLPGHPNELEYPA